MNGVAPVAGAGGPVVRDRLALPQRRLELLNTVRWALGYAFVAQTALQFLLKAWSEALEIALFVTIVGSFVVTTYLLKGVRGLVGLATDTFTQRLAALFLAALALTFLWGDQSPRSLLALLRLPTFLIIIALVVEILRSKERIAALAWTILATVCAIYALALIEFFFGSRALGFECADVRKCLQFKQQNWLWPGLSNYYWGIEDFSRHGGILNATVVAEAYGMGRLGMFTLLSYAVGMAIVLTSRHLSVKAIAVALVTFVLCGQILTGARSATLAVLGISVFLVVAVACQAKARRQAKTLILTNLAVFAVVALFWQMLPKGITSLDRLMTPTEDGESYGDIHGLATGKAGLIRRSSKSVVGLRIEGVALDETYEVQVRTLNQQGIWRATDEIAVDASSAIDRWHAECGNSSSCGDIVLTWHAFENTWWGIVHYQYRLRNGEGPWSPWQSFIAQPRDQILAELRRAVEDVENLMVVHYVGATVVDGWRTRNWQLAWDLFVANPLGGNGFRTFQQEASQRFGEEPNVISIVGVHSGYLKVLSEAGLLGMIPFLGLLAFASLAMLRVNAELAAPMVVWQIAFAGALMAMLAINVIDTHSEDRFFWLTLAFAAVLETWRRDAKASPEANQP